jgi:hypothetical protein
MTWTKEFSKSLRISNTNIRHPGMGLPKGVNLDSF